MSNLFLVSVVDLSLYNADEKLVTEINTVIEGVLRYEDFKKPYLAINDASFNLELMKLFGVVEDSEGLSDFKKATNNKSPVKIKFIRSTPPRHLKLIASGVLHGSDGEITHDFKIIAENVSITSGIEMSLAEKSVSEHNRVFEFNPDKNEELFELELTERK